MLETSYISFATVPPWHTYGPSNQPTQDFVHPSKPMLSPPTILSFPLSLEELGCRARGIVLTSDTFELSFGPPWWSQYTHDDVIIWKRFPRYWPFVRGIHWSLMNSPQKGQWHGALVFSLISAWTNGWANDRDAGDLQRHCAHYDVTVMRYVALDIHHTCPQIHLHWWKSQPFLAFAVFIHKGYLRTLHISESAVCFC